MPLEELQRMQELAEGLWWKVPFAITAAITVIYVFYKAISGDDRSEGRCWTPPCENPARDRSHAIAVHHYLFIVLVAGVVCCNSFGVNCTGFEFYFQKVFGLYFLFYSTVGIPAWISDAVEHRDYHAGLRKRT